MKRILLWVLLFACTADTAVKETWQLALRGFWAVAWIGVLQ